MSAGHVQAMLRLTFARDARWRALGRLWDRWCDPDIGCLPGDSEEQWRLIHELGGIEFRLRLVAKRVLLWSPAPRDLHSGTINARRLALAILENRP